MASRADNLAPLPPLLSKAVTGLLWVGIAYMVVTQLAQQFLLYGGISGEILHLGGAGFVVAADFIRRTRSVPRWIFGALSLAAVVVSASYFYVERDDILMRSVSGTTLDLVFTVTVLLIAFVFTYFAYGIIFPLIGLLAIGYTLWGQYLPDPFTGPVFTLKRVLSRLMLSVYGGLITTANDFIWLLLFWGVLLGTSGASIALMQAAQWISRALAGGPAMVATISSALVGSFTGAGPNNAAITGPLTIPTMRRAGYSAPMAAAVEAVASNGAALTPPILGTVAFLMAEVLGKRYIDIIFMALVPAVLWYLAVGVYVVAHARKEKDRISVDVETVLVENVSRVTTVKSAIIGIVPVLVLLVTVIQGTTLRFGVFWAFVALVVLSVVLRLETRRQVWSDTIKSAAIVASGVTLLLAVVTVFADVFVLSGLQTRLGDIIEDLSGGNLLWAVVLMMLVGVFLAAGLPTLAIYFLMALTFGPILLRFGVALEISHFMAFYMGSLSFIIPPVAVSAMITAGIAGTSYWSACRRIVIMALPLYFFPIVFVFAPELLLQGGGFGRTVFIVGAAAVSLVVMQLGSVGWFLRPLSTVWRAVAFAPAFVLFIGYLTDRDVFVLVALVASVAFLALWGVVRLRVGGRIGTSIARPAWRAENE